MAWLKKLFGGGRSERVDPYEAGVALLEEGKLDDALTSFRTALREVPGDPVILQQIAMTYTRQGKAEEAVKTYRHVLRKDPESPGAHYGLAFLLLQEGEEEEACLHLRAFLAEPPSGEEAQEHISHAQETLEYLTGSPDPMGGRDGRAPGRTNPFGHGRS